MPKSKPSTLVSKRPHRRISPLAWVLAYFKWRDRRQVRKLIVTHRPSQLLQFGFEAGFKAGRRKFLTAGWVRISKKEYAQLRQDINDYEAAVQTSFHRCHCGRIAERGIQCPGGHRDGT